jgi:acylphosphatase
MRTVQLRGSGRVQGVGYRQWAIDAATKLGVRGWVRNRADGTVEILATGPDAAVAALIEAAHEGPAAARVSAIGIAEADDDGSVGFTARATE